jgi:hypothetical protein
MVANLDDGLGIGSARFAEEANFNLRLVGGVPHRVADNIFDRTVKQLLTAYRAALVGLVKSHATVAITGFKIGVVNHLAQKIG